ncbi:hypothetical protein [Nocardioides iriomotensis]|uniref:hypothetical protein n=1 Tax=Nocardioides iriomotensis TaxID=715784 RepID=UPI0013EA0876|nr:hypothetical protein [Nocardioides iriomotensis]
MPTDDDLDPGAPTEMFQAFVDRAEERDGETARSWVAPLLVVVALLVAAGLAWLLLG